MSKIRSKVVAVNEAPQCFHEKFPKYSLNAPLKKLWICSSGFALIPSSLQNFADVPINKNGLGPPKG